MRSREGDRPPTPARPVNFEKLFTSSPGAYLVLAPDLTIIAVSDAYLKATMTRRAEVLGHGIFEVFPDNPDDTQATGSANLRSSLKKVLHSKRPHVMELQKYDIRRPEIEGGAFEVRFWNPVNVPILDERGEVECIIHAVEDVTQWIRLHDLVGDQHKLPSELRTSHTQLAAVILDEMYQFVGLLDSKGRVLEINRTALEAAGLRRADVRGEHLWTIPTWNISAENPARVERLVEEAMGGHFVREELELFAGAGGSEIVTIDFSLKPIFGDSNEITFLLAEGRNITERKAAEAEIERKTTELEALNGKLHELDQLKTQFFSNVSHELRTPLSLILGPVQKRLQNPGLDSELRKELEVIERNAALLLSHVNDLLDISKLEAGSMDLCYTDIDLARLCRLTASFFESLADVKRIHLEMRLPTTLTVQCDADKIQRVLLNLLANAFKFTPDHGKVWMLLESVDDSVRIVISDNGPGVPEHLRAAVFERFRQVDRHHTRQRGGTGLGLSLVKEFVEIHRGGVALAPTPGGGASFEIILPRMAPAGTFVEPHGEITSVATPAVVEQLRSSVFPAASAAPERPVAISAPLVLIVEDNRDVSDFLCGILSPWYRVLLAHDGVDGLEQLKAHRPDMVIADLMMPRMSGEEMLIEMKGLAELADIPVLMLTARAEPDLKIRLLRLGVQEFLTKPFSQEELLARVERVLAERRRELSNLRLSEERYRSLVEATASVVWTADQRGKFGDVHPSWELFTGQSAEEAVGSGWLQSFQPEDREKVAKAWSRSLEGGEQLQVEARIWSESEQSFRHVQIRAVPVRNLDRSIREWVGTIADIHERTLMERRLVVSNREKDVLLKEVHHRVKNNMQVISSLLRLQASHSGIPEFRSLLEESQSRVQAMALVHEKLYRSNAFSSIDFGDYVRLLSRELLAASLTGASDIELTLAIEPVELDINKAVPCGLIVNELLSNSFKHAFPDGRRGQVAVTLRQIALSDVELEIRDNGVGLPRDEQVTRKNASLGLQIVETLASQLGGSLTCSGAEGTCFTLRFSGNDCSSPAFII